MKQVNSNRDPSELIDNSHITIISSQWFRLRKKEYIEELANHQLMILDEAHHARLDNWKREKELYYTRKSVISKIIPNVLLLTATPFQTGEKDYLSLLDILQSVTEQDEEDLRIGSCCLRRIAPGIITNNQC